jgi:hypothetical protein
VLLMLSIGASNEASLPVNLFTIAAENDNVFVLNTITAQIWEKRATAAKSRNLFKPGFVQFAASPRRQ